MFDKYIDYDHVIEVMLQEHKDNLAALESLTEQYNELLTEDGVHAVRYDKGGGCAGLAEDRVANIAIQRQAVGHRLHQLKAECRLFEQAWNRLEGEERQVLEAFYMKGMQKKDALDFLCEQLCCERTKVYTMRTKAVSRMKRLLFG